LSTGLVTAPESLQKFWTTLPESQCLDSILALSGANFLGHPRYGSKLFVRQCFAEFSDAITREMDAGKRGIIITGNPGCLFVIT
jgi:hypothetical protein